MVSRQDTLDWRRCTSCKFTLQLLSKASNVEEMLPFGGQGSNQAIEDAGALGYLCNGLETGETVMRSLDMFDTVRRKRASRVQILSKVRVGKEKDVREELLQYADPPGSGESSLMSGKHIVTTLQQCPSLSQSGTFMITGEWLVSSRGVILAESFLGLMLPKAVPRC